MDLYGGLFNGFVAVSVVGMFATIGHLYARPHEPSHQDLLGLDLTPEQAKAVEALKEFRRLLVDGAIAAHPSSSTSSEDHVPPALFAADGGRLLILGTGDRSAIKPWKKKPVGAIRVEWVPQRHVPIGNGSATDALRKTASPGLLAIFDAQRPAPLRSRFARYGGEKVPDFSRDGPAEIVGAMVRLEIGTHAQLLLRL